MNLSFRPRRSKRVRANRVQIIPKSSENILVDRLNSSYSKATLCSAIMSSSTKLPFLRNNFQSNALGGGKLFLNCIGHKKAVSLFNRFVSSTTVVSIVAFVFGCFCAPPAATFFLFVFVLFAFAEGEEVVVFLVIAFDHLLLRRRRSFGGAFFFFSSSPGGSTLALFDRPLLKATTPGVVPAGSRFSLLLLLLLLLLARFAAEA